MIKCKSPLPKQGERFMSQQQKALTPDQAEAKKILLAYAARKKVRAALAQPTEPIAHESKSA